MRDASVAKWLAHLPFISKVAGLNLNENFSMTMRLEPSPHVKRVKSRRSAHSRTQSPSYARCDEGLWPNPYSELASDWLVLTPDIVFLPCFYGIRLWIWPEPLVAPRVRRALGTRMRSAESRRFSPGTPVSSHRES